MMATVMRKILKGLGETLILLFCLWHMIAVGLYCLPKEARDPVTVFLRDSLAGYVRPYMLITSQWQQWNLFSPDPLRQVTSYIIETQGTDTAWTAAAVLAPGTVAWWRDADELKLMRNMQETRSLNPVRQRYLQLFCQERQLASGTPIRLTYEYYVLPATSTPLALSWWQHWKPAWSRTVGAVTRCPYLL